jgi:hypothetical protein
LAVRRKHPPARFGFLALPVGLAVRRKHPPARFGFLAVPVGLAVRRKHPPALFGLLAVPVGLAVAVLALGVPALPLTQRLAVAVLGFG